MKNLFKRIRNLFSKKEKTPLELKKEVVVDTFFSGMNVDNLGAQDRTKYDKLVHGIAKGTFIVDKYLADIEKSKEEQFKEKVADAVLELINKHYGDETHELRERIKSLEGQIKDKDRELSMLQNIKEVMA